MNETTESEARRLQIEIDEAVSILRSELDRDDDLKDTLHILVVVAVNSLARLKEENKALRDAAEPFAGRTFGSRIAWAIATWKNFFRK